MTINYDNGKRKNHVQAMAEGYEAISKERGDEVPETPTMIEQIKARHAAGVQLSTMEKMLLGTHEADVKRQEKLQARKQAEE